MDDSYELIARERVFVLLDGTFVVQWNDHQVQELLSGAYRAFDAQAFGAAITDFELDQLKQAGIVTQFEGDQVWLLPAFQRLHYYQMYARQKRFRTYYLNTTLSDNQLAKVAACLERLDDEQAFELRIQDGFIVIFAEDGSGFDNFDAAEEARLYLLSHAPEVFAETVVAFVEMPRYD